MQQKFQPKNLPKSFVNKIFPHENCLKNFPQIKISQKKFTKQKFHPKKKS